MPYKSEAQRRFFNINRKRLEAEGVDVDEWNQASKGKKLPEKKANTPGQTGNIPVTPPTTVRPEAAPSAHIPRPARRQTTLADMRGKQAMSTQKVDMPFFYLLAGLAKSAAQVKAAKLPESGKSIPVKHPTSELRPFKGGPMRGGLGVQMTTMDRLGLGPNVAPGTLQANLSNLASNLGEFATSPLGIGAGLGLGALGTGMYLGSRRKRDEDEKEAGVFSEYAGALNPIYALGPSQLGFLAAALTPTRNLNQQVASDDELWSNLLVPGRGAYNLAKRTGASLRSPEMLAKQKEHLRKKRQKAIESARIESQDEKVATIGSVTETLSGLNPLNFFGGAVLGGGAALATPTRTLEEQAAHDADRTFMGHAADVLVPGLGAYNALKRLGSMVRSPEIKKLKAQHGLKQLESEIKADEDEKEAGVRSLARVAAKSRIKQSSEPSLSDNLIHYVGIPAATLGAGALTGTGLAAMAHPLQELFYSDDDEKARNQRFRERLLTGAGAGTGVGLSSLLRHLNSPVATHGR